MTLQFINKCTEDRFFWKRLVLVFISLALIYFWYSGMMLHHVYDSPFQYKGADFTYWLFYFMHIVEFLTLNETIALSFSVLLLLSFLLSFIFIRNRFLTIIAGCLLLIYQIAFNTKIAYHTHHLFGFQFALLPFYFKDNLFKSALGLARILCCLSYFFAGFFKLYQGAWLSYESFAHVLENQHSAWMYLHPSSVLSSSAFFLIQHPAIGFVFFISAMLLQLSFIMGIFTNRWNTLFALFILLFHVMDWYLMNLGVFMGMTVMMWLLLYKDNTGRKAD